MKPAFLDNFYLGLIVDHHYRGGIENIPTTPQNCLHSFLSWELHDLTSVKIQEIGHYDVYIVELRCRSLREFIPDSSKTGNLHCLIEPHGQVDIPIFDRFRRTWKSSRMIPMNNLFSADASTEALCLFAT